MVPSGKIGDNFFLTKPVCASSLDNNDGNISP